MSQKVLDTLRARFGDALLGSGSNRGDEQVMVDRARLVELCGFLRDDPAMGFDMLVDLCGVDYLTFKSPRARSERFEVVIHLMSLTHAHRLRIKVPVPEDDAVVPTLTGLWKSANWCERETWDMYGVRFDGHPNLRRVLLYDEFEGHPLRKDYPTRAYQPLLDMPGVQGDELPWQSKADEEA
jgi:NADH-quinone oxidoreductase subunit C